MLISAGKLARQQRRLNAAMPLVLFTDDSGRDWAAAAGRLPRGSAIVIRSREAKKRAALLERLAPLPGLKLLVADDPALAQSADGLHLPQARAQEAGHWRVRRPDWIITASAHSLRDLITLAHLDAVFLSPVFATASHPDAVPLTPVRAAFIAALSPVPVYALGGVTARNAPRLAPAFAGIAAIAALSAG